MATLGEIADSFLELKSKLTAEFESTGWDLESPISDYQSYGAGFSIETILNYIQFTCDRIRNLSKEDIIKEDLGKYLGVASLEAQSISFSRFSSDPGAAINNVMFMMQMINDRLPTQSKGPVKLDWESVSDKSVLPRDLARRLRAIDIRLSDLEPRSAEIEQKISDIESAHEAAEQLPEDLAELAAKREHVTSIVAASEALYDSAKKSADKIEAMSDASVEARERMALSEDQAVKLIARSEQALRGATGVGLAKAFENRQEKLSRAGTIWVIGLVGALFAALYIGAQRVSALQSVLTNDSPSHIVWMNVVLTIFGIGGPVWFAWLSTKQISVSFRLAEDYAFKAAVSKAYEGYRSEAISIDPALQERLFSSALDRFEESPIRLMEKESHSSPLQELLANPTIRKSLEGIPGIADKIIALIPEKGGVAAVVGSAAAVTAAVSADAPAPPKTRTKKAEDE